MSVDLGNRSGGKMVTSSHHMFQGFDFSFGNIIDFLITFWDKFG